MGAPLLLCNGATSSPTAGGWTLRSPSPVIAHICTGSPPKPHGTGIVLPAKYRDHPFGTSTTKCLQCSGRQAMESRVTRLVTFM